MNGFVKKCLKFDVMKNFYPVRTDEEVLNNYENNKFAILILAVYCALFYLSENTPGFLVSYLTYVFFAGALTLSLMAKKHIQQTRKYADVIDILMFVFPEYYTVNFLCRNTFETFKSLMIISVIAWVISLLIKLPYIIGYCSKNTGEKSFQNYKKTMNIIITLVLGVALFIFAKVRYGGIETVKVPVFVLAFHLCFSMWYIFLINRIVFSIVYHPEINAELEQQRENK